MDCDDFYERAIKEEDRGDYHKALSDFTKALTFNKVHMKSYWGRARCQRRLGQLKEALNDFSRAIELSPMTGGLYFNRAETHVDLENYPSALKDFQMALDKGFCYPVVHASMGNAHMALADTNAALQAFGEAIRLNPAFSEALIHRGKALCKIEQFFEAYNDFTAAMKECDDKAICYILRGETCLALGDYDNAIDDFNWAVQLDPRSKIARQGRDKAIEAKTRFDEKKRAAASSVKSPNYSSSDKQNESNVDDYTIGVGMGASRFAYGSGQPASSKDITYAEIGSSSISVSAGHNTEQRTSYRDLINQGKELCGKCDYKGALEKFSLAIKQDPRGEEGFMYRGQMREALGDLSRAIEDYCSAVAINPWSAHSLHLRGRGYGKRGDHEEAIADLTKSISLDPKNADLLVERGKVFVSMKDSKSALEDFDTALNFRVANVGAGHGTNGTFEYTISDIHFQKAWALFVCENLPAASKDLEAALELDQKNGDFYYLRGHIGYMQKKYREAIADFQNALELCDGYPSGTVHCSIMLSIVYRKSKQREQGEEVLIKVRNMRTNEFAECEESALWPYPVIEYMLGSKTERELLEAASTDEQILAARAYIGTHLLLDGKRTEAVEQFHTVKESNRTDCHEYHLVLNELYAGES